MRPPRPRRAREPGSGTPIFTTGVRNSDPRKYEDFGSPTVLTYGTDSSCNATVTVSVAYPLSTKVNLSSLAGYKLKNPLPEVYAVESSKAP